ncbi:hypothetical protein ACJX0J_038414, partial [Zea mays]
KIMLGLGRLGETGEKKIEGILHNEGAMLNRDENKTHFRNTSSSNTGWTDFREQSLPSSRDNPPAPVEGLYRGLEHEEGLAEREKLNNMEFSERNMTIAWKFHVVTTHRNYLFFIGAVNFKSLANKYTARNLYRDIVMLILQHYRLESLMHNQVLKTAFLKNGHVKPEAA